MTTKKPKVADNSPGIADTAAVSAMRTPTGFGFAFRFSIQMTKPVSMTTQPPRPAKIEPAQRPMVEAHQMHAPDEIDGRIDRPGDALPEQPARAIEEYRPSIVADAILSRPSPFDDRVGVAGVDDTQQRGLAIAPAPFGLPAHSVERTEFAPRAGLAKARRAARLVKENVGLSRIGRKK